MSHPNRVLTKEERYILVVTVDCLVSKQYATIRFCMVPQRVYFAYLMQWNLTGRKGVFVLNFQGGCFFREFSAGLGMQHHLEK